MTTGFSCIVLRGPLSANSLSSRSASLKIFASGATGNEANEVNDLAVVLLDPLVC